MSDQIRQQIDNLDIAIKDYQSTLGEALVRRVVPAVDDLAIWIGHFRSQSDGTALELLGGLQAAGLEVVTYTSLGLGRAAITAIRLQIDIALGYTYFKDHPLEWDNVKRTGEGYMLRGDIEKYHDSLDRKLKIRVGYLNKKPYRGLKKIYSILSAHVHGQSPYTLPSLGPLESSVLGADVMDSIVEIQHQSVKALSHYLVAIYAKEWPQLPAKFVNEVSDILTSKQRPLFFSD